MYEVVLPNEVFERRVRKSPSASATLSELYSTFKGKTER